MRIGQIILSLIVAATPVAYLSAQDASRGNIVEYMERDSHEQVSISQPAKLAERLDARSGSKDNGAKSVSKNAVGYRIQIFADNNQRTAKSEAVARERNIAARYPEMGCYLTYKAPAWRLRIGDFVTREEAVEFMNVLKKEFPSYSREMIVVVDRINVAL